MTDQGIVVLTLIGLVLLFWILDLVRRDRLYVGYGVIFILCILAVILVLTIPFLLALLTQLVGAFFPASALTLLALFFIVFMLVYVLSQVTIVSNRLALVVQELAVERAKEAASIGLMRKREASENPDSADAAYASGEETHDAGSDESALPPTRT